MLNITITSAFAALLHDRLLSCPGFPETPTVFGPPHLCQQTKMPRHGSFHRHADRVGGPCVRWLRSPACLALGVGLGMRYLPGSVQPGAVPVLETLEVDQGDVSLVVTENGFLESSVDDVVRCRVESMMGLPVAAAPSGGQPVAVPRASSRIGGGGSSTIRSRDSALNAVTKALAGAKSRLMGVPGTATSAASCAGSAKARATVATNSGGSSAVRQRSRRWRWTRRVP